MRMPIIYLAGSCQSQIVDNIKHLIKSHDYPGPVEFIDPKNLITRDKFYDIECVNNTAISKSDLMVCIMINQTAGAAIELYICTRIVKTEAILVTSVPEDKLTPRIRSLVSTVCDISLATSVIYEWIQKWYEEKE